MVYLKRKENKKFTILKYLGLFLFMCGIFMFIYYYASTKKLNDNENTKIESFFEEEIIDNPVEEQTEDSPKTTTSNKTD